MRNPIRPKNLRLRFLPLYLLGIAILLLQPPRPGAAVAALPLIALGTALRAWGAGHLVKNDVLTTTGPYAHLRHPLYLGTLLVGTGFAVWIGGWIALAVLALLWPWFALRYFPRKEASESRRLEAAYGDRFRRYRDAVPALWPRWHAYHETEPAAGGGGRWQLGRYDANNELGTLLALSVGVLLFWLRSEVGGG
jgi:protein-S-isoprenylcysteine O-methyltransferase Ste14